MRPIIVGTVLLFCSSCASPTFITQPVQDEPNLLVGFASYNDQAPEAPVMHDHPMEWSEADLYAILAGLVIQERGGIMDTPKPPQTVFFPEEIRHLLPGLHEAFRVAGPSDWVVFALWVSSTRSQALEVTSGGMFLQDRRLHVILANHRARVVSETDGITAIRRNPLRLLREVKGTLLFDPAAHVIDSRANWVAGGFESPAAELILDYKTFLASARRSTPTGVEGRTASGSSGSGFTRHPPPSRR